MVGDPSAVAERVLSLLPAGTEGQVRATDAASALTRFANSFIHQNVADEGVEIAVTVAKGKQVASASAHLADDDALERFVASVVDAAGIAPEMADWPGVIGGPQVEGRGRSREPPR